MPCVDIEYLIQTFEETRPKRQVALAEEGITEDEIFLLEKEVQLAREKAKMDSYSRGETLTQQRERMKKATREAVQQWLDDLHAKLRDQLMLLQPTGDAKAYEHIHGEPIGSDHCPCDLCAVARKVIEREREKTR